jgi:tetratricopeptide (TPR) repeat protein
MRSGIALSALFFLLLGVGVPGQARADAPVIDSANTFLQKKMYRDAIKVLQPAIAKQGDPASSQELRLMAEAHYMLKEYGTARTLFLRALPLQKSPEGTISCEARLSVIDYRLGDYEASGTRIDEFLRKYPNDGRVGTLLVLRMRIIQEGRLPAEEKRQKMEAEYAKVVKEKERFGYYNFVLAAQALGEFYTQSGEGPKAIALYVKAATEMRNLILAMKDSGKAVPRDLSQGVDGMQLQIARYYIGRKEYGEAQKWLENISAPGNEKIVVDDEMKSQAKYLLAQLNYQKGALGEVLFHLQDELIARTPEGETKWGMCMLAAFAWRDGPSPDVEKAKELLKQIPASSAAFSQAQHALGDIYRDQKDPVRAEPYYLESLKSLKYAPEALFRLAQILKTRAETMKPKNETEKAARDTLLGRAGAYLQELLIKYPLADSAKEAKAMVESLSKQGVTVNTEASEDEKVAMWEKTAREKAGSNEAGQALMSLIRYHSRQVVDPKTGVVEKAPNWKAVADSCEPIVKSPKPFSDVSSDRWQELQAHANFYLGRAELGSLAVDAGKEQGEVAVPVRAEGGTTARALEFLQKAQQLARPQQDIYREIDFALVEAMLKSEDRKVREDGERRYAEMETKYGTDPNYQRLAVIIADWLDDHGQFELAGRTYRSVARKAGLDQGATMQLLYQAGVSYGKAGRAAVEAATQMVGFAFSVLPRSVNADLASAMRSLPEPPRRVLWEAQGPDLTAGEALTRVSREFGVPFVWSPATAPGSVSTYLRTTKIPRATLVSWREARTLESYLGLLVGTNRFGIAFDLGASGGTPTIQPKPGEGDDAKVIEIYDLAQPRFPALAKPYGDFGSVHKLPVMVHTIVQRIQELTGARVLWGEGVAKEDVLAHELKALPGLPGGKNAACTDVLKAALDTVGLRYEVVRRDRSRDLFEESNGAFDELRRFGKDSRFAEESTYNIAVNLYFMKDYGKMKLLLAEYLKNYGPSFPHHYDANFWLGRLYEIDRTYREAVKYYSKAAEERVWIYRPSGGQAASTLDEIKARLSFDSLFNLSRKCSSGAMSDMKLDPDILAFIKFHTTMELAIDPGLRGNELAISRDAFLPKPCIEFIHGILVDRGLDLRTENGNPEVAEKAYYRLALVYKEDNLMRDALENVNTLLTRFPKSSRRLDAMKLKLEIYKGLKDYANVLAALEALKATGGDGIEPHLMDYEFGRVYFDLCDYDAAMQSLSRALSGSRNPEETARMREALAVTYLRVPARWPDALSAYRETAESASSALRQSADAMMIWFLECATAKLFKSKPLPEKEATFLKMYEGLTDKQREDMSENELTRATWIYYGMGLMNRHVNTNRMDALRAFEAASTSPDPYLASEAMYEAGLLLLGDGNHRRARETLEHLLFVTKNVESAVKGTYALAECLSAMGERDEAFQRYDEVVTRFPISPYAAMARTNALYVARKAGAGAGTGTNAVPAAATKRAGSGGTP